MTIKRKFVVPALLSLYLAGCTPLVLVGVGGAAGIVGYKYYEGALTVIYQAPYMETWDATLRALEKMDLTITSKDHDSMSGKIKAKRTDDKPVTVGLEYRSSNETEVVIRVGNLGDKEASAAIKERIRKELFGGG
jgi:uncharacterized lipoprotein